jgi:hypothetical protein
MSTNSCIITHPNGRPAIAIIDIEEERGSQSAIRDHLVSPSQATAFVSIMQGCNMHCAFCIVPQTRGAERSRSIAEITDEVRKLAARGVKEVTHHGQIVKIYGRHEFEKRDGLSPFVRSTIVSARLTGSLAYSPPRTHWFPWDLIGVFGSGQACWLATASGSNQFSGYGAVTRRRRMRLVEACIGTPRHYHDRYRVALEKTDGDYNQTRDLADESATAVFQYRRAAAGRENGITVAEE